MPSLRSTSPSASPSAAGSGQNVRSAFDEHGLATEPLYDLRHLDTEWSGSEDDQALWNGLHRGRLPTGPDAAKLTEPRNGWDDRVCARREDDVVRRVSSPVHLDRTGPGQPTLAAQQSDAVVGQPTHLPVVRVVRDHEVPPGEGCFHIDIRRREGIPGPPAPPHPAAAASWRGCTRNTSIHRPRALVRSRLPGGRLRPALRHSARLGSRHQSRSRRNRSSDSSLTRPKPSLPIVVALARPGPRVIPGHWTGFTHGVGRGDRFSCEPSTSDRARRPSYRVSGMFTATVGDHQVRPWSTSTAGGATSTGASSSSSSSKGSLEGPSIMPVPFIKP
jgi:hypothetical protein